MKTIRLNLMTDTADRSVEEIQIVLNVVYSSRAYIYHNGGAWVARKYTPAHLYRLTPELQARTEAFLSD